MKRLDDIPLELAIELYFTKHIALREGDMPKLIALRQEHPEIFNKEKDKEIRDIILYAKKFEDSPQYKILRRLLLKDSLQVIITHPK